MSPAFYGEPGFDSIAGPLKQTFSTLVGLSHLQVELSGDNLDDGEWIILLEAFPQVKRITLECSSEKIDKQSAQLLGALQCKPIRSEQGALCPDLEDVILLPDVHTLDLLQMLADTRTTELGTRPLKLHVPQS